MKGAIGNALILNIVITFMILFFSLLIGSMAYSKAYKTKNFMIELLNQYESKNIHDLNVKNSENRRNWDNTVNDYLRKSGYPISSASTCNDLRKKYDATLLVIGNDVGSYDYCVFKKCDNDECESRNSIIGTRYNYLVLVYMKLDFPVFGNYIKIPITGETKTYTRIKQLYNVG